MILLSDERPGALLDATRRLVDAKVSGIRALLHGAPVATTTARSHGFASDIGRTA
jgi:hypothetical protein